MKLRLLPAMGIMAIALGAGQCARASLGGDMASVRDDQAKMQGTLQTTSGESYDVHEIQAPNGVVVREYASRAGNVFGVAWSGRTHPDLRQVLGSNYALFVRAVQAQRAQRHGHGPLLIQEPGLVVQTGGHMRSLRGRAYLPQAMPASVRPEDIR